MRRRNNIPYLAALLVILFYGCSTNSNKPVKDPIFKVLDHTKTGLDFANNLHPSKDFNVFDYMYYYNGGGVGVADFNNDGLTDVFYIANQGNNTFYLNKGELHFEDVTAQAKIPQDSGWSTGVSVVDINNDGLMDIYICKVGRLSGLPVTHNQLLVCQGIDKNGIPFYEDRAKDYGLDFSGFSTQAVFFDYDGDGDLDMFLLTHSVQQNTTFGKRSEKLKISDPYSGNRLYRNDGNNHFTDITAESGIHHSIINFGLGISVSDINLDGYPDLYICNDFYENDYLYINQHNGTFKDALEEQITHTSQFSMGVDVADVNNDAYPEILSTDMLPYDPYILKKSEGGDSWDVFNSKIEGGYHEQYTRNNFQWNRRNGHFSEIGLYSGIAATDWSWSPLWMDFDNDGLKDLFVSNGIPKRLNDIDYIDFVSTQEIQQKLSPDGSDNKDMDLISKFPQIKLPSKFFKNEGSMVFKDQGNKIDGNRPMFSNGAAYADFDNDGDLDILVNNIDEPSLLYQNLSNDIVKKPFVDIKLKGSEKNINALGAKLILFANDGIRTYEKYPVHGYMSSMEIPIHVGLDKTKVDSAFLIWPDNTFQRIDLRPDLHSIHLSWQKNLPVFNYAVLSGYSKTETRPVKDITRKTGLFNKHEENYFHEFDKEPLIPHMLSAEGPALAVADINRDGRDDVFIGSSKGKKSSIWMQTKSGTFVKSVQYSLDADSASEDVSACWADVNKDGNMDLIVAGGGNESYGEDPALTPRVYLGDGEGHFNKLADAFNRIFVNASSVTACDFDGDGYADLFIGGRSVPGSYGQIPHSYLLHNNGNGKFTEVTDQLAPSLSNIGFVSSALWFDINKDGQKDLLLSLEWGGIVAFLNDHGHFTKKILTDKKGWWNFILPVDLNHDGNTDLVIGNLGLNSRLKASGQEPVRMYYNDFDGNGKKEQVLTYYVNGHEISFANKDELENQLPVIRKKFLYAEDFAKASLPDLLSAEKISSSDLFSADYFSNAILINDGNLNFKMEAMPWEAQLSSYKDAVAVDANGDDLPDILLVGNYYESNIQMGRYDADYGTILLNKGNHSFKAVPLNGMSIQGQVRHIAPIRIAGKESYLLVKNNDSTRVLRFEDPK